ncbi:aldo/keto reductase [Streptomyces edwardsiae]|uniref:Aldo/keto reductase n=1 Tax=Streptomyces edwardsiae TaxID=3075527 RepID=A0ABU2QLD4_9ACTN|nr:aldo/keto reductase [Streptomyces sp. DSM 41635]MDT0405278.1 aldo/keto reductase [Streptomyces sp. DSM 41635]
MSGYPHDVDDAITVLRRAAELGVSLIDTADSYRPFVTHDPIRKALHPYPEHLAIATKTGVSRPRRAGTDRAPRVPWPAGRTQPPAPGRGADRPAPTAPCRRRGATRRPSRRARPPPGRRQDPPHRPPRGHRSTRSRPLNASHPSPRCTTCSAWSTAPRPTYSTTPSSGKRPSFPDGHWPAPDSPAAGELADLVRRTGATISLLAPAWLLRRSPVILPIPSTPCPAHLEDNLKAAEIDPSDEDFATPDRAATHG